MAKRIFELQETKGTFQVKGLVSGAEKDGFYTSKKTKTGKDFRNINFGCMYDNSKTVFVNLNGMPQQNVYFSKRNQDGKTETKPIPWANRHKFNEEGFRMIGVNVGLEKTTDDKGKTVNLKKMMAPYDACEYIKENLKDDASVFIRGNLEFSSFTADDGTIRRGLKYVPNQVSLCQEVDFNAYSDADPAMHNFTQHIVFTDITKETVNEVDTGRFILSAKIVTYNDIIDTEFIITNKNLANKFKKDLKPYNAITVHGIIEVSHTMQEIDEDDCWGDANAMNSVSAPTKTELIITGATPSTIDKETYTEQNIAAAMKQIRASKEADNKFVVESNNSSDDGWGDDPADDDDMPW